MKHQVLKIDDLLKDKTFHNWVYRTNQIDIDYWNGYLIAHPDQELLLREAAEMIKGIPVRETSLPLQDVSKYWFQLEEKINTGEKLKVASLSDHKFYWWSAAAVVLLCAFFSFIYFVSFNDKKVSYSTAYGEKKEVVLPDNSIVVLNSNSSLTYYESNTKYPSRIVELSGEAFFSVRHTKDHKKFIVRTSDQVNVEVLGTSFNVSNRAKETSVVLSTGKIKLNIEKQKESLTMAPGEMVVFEEKESKITRSKVNPEIYSAWKDNKLIFDDSSLEEIIEVIRENYGIEVQVSDKKYLQKRFTGTFPADKLNVLFEALSNSFNLQYTRSESKVLLKPFKQNF